MWLKFLILIFPKGFCTSYQIPAETIALKYKPVNGYADNFYLFLIIVSKNQLFSWMSATFKRITDEDYFAILASA